MQVCPNGFESNVEKSLCVQLFVPECIEYLLNLCIRCANNKLAQNNVCVLECQDGFFKLNDDVCESCTPNCVKCSSKNTCDLCLNNSFKILDVKLGSIILCKVTCDPKSGYF